MMKLFLAFLFPLLLSVTVLAVKHGGGVDDHSSKFSVSSPNGIQKNTQDRTAQPPPAPYYGVPVKPNQRIVAAGDLPSDFKSCVAVLRMASVIDDQNKWIGGNTILKRAISQTEVLTPNKYGFCSVVSWGSPILNVKIFKYPWSVLPPAFRSC